MTDKPMNVPPEPCCGPSCCGGVKKEVDVAVMTSAIGETYAGTARAGLSSDNAGVRAVAEAFGYSAEEMASIPAAANMGLSCGNPTAMANLRPGEVVVDLGSGGGLDVFLAAQKIGPTGRAIGIDMTPAMIELARANAVRSGLANVEFHLAAIDTLPLQAGSVDVVISNCVINLAADKPAVFREIARVLRPGGRVAVSDIVLKKPLPEALANNVMAYVGCIAGAITTRDYVAGLTAAGFTGVTVVDSGADLNAYGNVENQAACCSPGATSSTTDVSSSGCCGTTSSAKVLHNELSELICRHDLNEYAASVKVFAIRS